MPWFGLPKEASKSVHTRELVMENRAGMAPWSWSGLPWGILEWSWGLCSTAPASSGEKLAISMEEFINLYFHYVSILISQLSSTFLPCVTDKFDLWCSPSPIFFSLGLILFFVGTLTPIWEIRAQLVVRVVPEQENPPRTPFVKSGYGYEKLGKNGYGAGTLKVGMRQVQVWI